MQRPNGVRKISERVTLPGRSVIITNPKVSSTIPDWDETYQYIAGQCVHYSDEFYIAIQTTTKGEFNPIEWEVIDLGEEVPVDQFTPDGTLAVDIKNMMTVQRETVEEYKENLFFKLNSVGPYVFNDKYNKTDNPELIKENQSGIIKVKLPANEEWSDVPLLTAEAFYDEENFTKYIVVKSGGMNLFRVKLD